MSTTNNTVIATFKNNILYVSKSGDIKTFPVNQLEKLSDIPEFETTEQYTIIVNSQWLSNNNRIILNALINATTNVEHASTTVSPKLFADKLEYYQQIQLPAEKASRQSAIDMSAEDKQLLTELIEKYNTATIKTETILLSRNIK